MGIDERRGIKAGIRLNLGSLQGARPGFIGGALMIMFGTLLFLDNLNILPVSVFDAFWPLIFIGGGAYAFKRSCSPVVRIWAATAAFYGFLLILDLIRIIHVTGATVWPLALIALGISLIVTRLRWDGLVNRFSADRLNAGRFNVGSNTATRPLVSRLEEYAVFSTVKRRIETQAFEGGELSSVFGGIEIDLRYAGISTPGKVAILESNAAFGAVEIRIPDTWRLSMQGTAIFGAYEDKTIPPRPEPGVETPTLVIKGGTAFGAVVVRN